jgi:hypothetical protein
VARPPLSKDLDPELGFRRNEDHTRGPHRVLLARSLAQTRPDPATLLALRLYLGWRNGLGAVVTSTWLRDNSKAVVVEFTTERPAKQITPSRASASRWRVDALERRVD